MGVDTSAVAMMPTSAVDPMVAEAIAMQERLEPLKNALNIGDLTGEEMSLFAMVALRMRLDPFAKQIYAIKRKGKVTFQTGIDGFRSSAEETGQYRGSDEPVFGDWIEKPYGHPEWAQVTVRRVFPDGTVLEQPATAWWDEFVVTAEGQDFQWKKMPRVMLAKCAEAAAFRKAFPRRFGGVYVTEEMQQAEAVEQARPVGETARDRVAARRAELEAQTTSAERPAGEALPSSPAPEDAGPSSPAPSVDMPAPEGDGDSEAGTTVVEGQATTRCPSMSDGSLGEPVQCRQAEGHRGMHRTADRSWPA